MTARQRWWTHTTPIRGSWGLSSPDATRLCIHFSWDDSGKIWNGEDVSHTRLFGLFWYDGGFIYGQVRSSSGRPADTLRSEQRTVADIWRIENRLQAVVMSSCCVGESNDPSLLPMERNPPALGLSGFSAGSRKPDRPIASGQT